MPAQIIDGRALVNELKEQCATRASDLRDSGNPAKLDAILVSSGDNAAKLYADKQAMTCQSLGIDYQLHTLPEGSSEQTIESKVRQLNEDDRVHAMMLHMPLPDGVDVYRIKSLIDPEKDAESVSPTNIGSVVYGRSMRAPCTAVAALRMIESTNEPIRGATCVVVGASATVGRPLAVLLMQREATVISCNKYTKGLAALCREADIVIAAAGVPNLITQDMVREGAMIIDVGVNRVHDPETGETQTVGDVDFERVREKAGWITPVPGGVGPMTVGVLLHQVVDLASIRYARATHCAATR